MWVEKGRPWCSCMGTGSRAHTCSRSRSRSRRPSPCSHRTCLAMGVVSGPAPHSVSWILPQRSPDASTRPVSNVQRSWRTRWAARSSPSSPCTCRAAWDHWCSSGRRSILSGAPPATSSRRSARRGAGTTVAARPRRTRRRGCRHPVRSWRLAPVGARRPNRAAPAADRAADGCRARRERRVRRREVGREGHGPPTAWSARRRPREPHAVHYTRPDLIARIVHELLVEEGEQVGSQLRWGLPHRHVPALETDEPGAGQDSLPLRGDPGRKKPVVLSPDQQRPGSNGRELRAQVPVGHERGPRGGG